MENANPSSSTPNSKSLHPKKKLEIRSWLEDSKIVDTLVSSDDVAYFDTFPTLEELGYHEWLLKYPKLSWVRAKIRTGDLNHIKISCMIGHFLKRQVLVSAALPFSAIPLKKSKLKVRSSVPALVITGKQQLSVEGFDNALIIHVFGSKISRAKKNKDQVSIVIEKQDRRKERAKAEKVPKKPDLTYFHIFGALCYPTNDGKDLGKLKPKSDIGIFIGYAPAKKAYRIYNRQTRLIMEAIHVEFDELTTMASEQFGLGLELQLMTPGKITPVNDNTTGTPSSTSIDQDAPSASTSPTSIETQSPVISQGAEEQLQPALFDNDLFYDIVISEPNQDNPTHVYKLKKSLYGLKQAPQAWYDILSSFLLSQEFSKGAFDPTLFTRKEGKDILMTKYALEILKKYGMDFSNSVDTPMVERTKLDEDLWGTRVDATCKAYQKALTCGKTDLLIPERNHEYGPLFLGDRLVSWSSKKQKSTAISSTKAEYIALSGCCAQILWIRS
ncbi:retrovirus-related pol polyprotein from transposon TNT 1-94 [Tanacetum coccineum]